MKRILFVLLCTLFFACENETDNQLTYEQLQEQNKKLEAIIAEKATIVSVTFEKENMSIKFSSGDIITTPIPAELKGKDGTSPTIGENGNWFIGDTDTGIKARGDNGDGIKNISYDKTTNIMTITLTNDTKFELNISTDNGLSASLISDTNGEYLISNIHYGDVNIANLTYNDKNELIKLQSYTNKGPITFKHLETEKTYSSEGKVEFIKTKKYATSLSVKYYDTDYGTLGEKVKFDKYKGYSFYEEVSTNNYNYYSSLYNDGANYYYIKYSNAIINEGDRQDIRQIDGKHYYCIDDYSEYKRLSIPQYEVTVSTTNTESYHIINDDNTISFFKAINYNDKTYFREFKNVKSSEQYYGDWSNDNFLSKKTDNDNEFIIYRYYSYYTFTENSITKYLYIPKTIRKITKIVKLGDLMSEEKIKNEYNTDGRLEYIYITEQSDKTYLRRKKLCYNTHNKISKIELEYNKDGIWTADNKYFTNKYNDKELLMSTTKVEGDESLEILNITYDHKDNPTEISKYFNDRKEYSGSYIDPETGLYNEKFIIRKAGLYSAAKIEYNYNMKNFMNHAIEAIYPDLAQFKFNNAFSRAVITDSFKYGFIKYDDFNDGGYPREMNFVGSQVDISMAGQLIFEYIKKK